MRDFVRSAYQQAGPFSCVLAQKGRLRPFQSHSPCLGIWRSDGLEFGVPALSATFNSNVDALSPVLLRTARHDKRMQLMVPIWSKIDQVLEKPIYFILYAEVQRYPFNLRNLSSRTFVSLILCPMSGECHQFPPDQLVRYLFLNYNTNLTDFILHYTVPHSFDFLSPP